MPETDWLPAAELADLPPGKAMEAVVGDVIVALVNINGEVHARFLLRSHAERFIGVMRGEIFPDPKLEPGAYGQYT